MHERKLDQAARAAWLYYVAGNTQDEIAHKLNVSRQAVQRLVSLAVGAKLIKFRLDHPLAACMALGHEIARRFGLGYCDVQPADPAAASPVPSIAIGAAEYLATFLGQKAPLVVAFSTGRTLRAMAGEVPNLACPQHRFVSLVGAVSRDGQASAFEVVMRLAERVGARCFPMPAPVVTSSVEELRMLQSHHAYAVIRDLAREAGVAFVGISHVAPGSPLHADGFVTRAEIDELVRLGAVGEIAGWAFDRDGRVLAGGTNERVAAIPLPEIGGRLVAAGGGPEKVTALAAALRGRLLHGLITDETTAAAILAEH